MTASSFAAPLRWQWPVSRILPPRHIRHNAAPQDQFERLGAVPGDAAAPILQARRFRPAVQPPVQRIVAQRVDGRAGVRAQRDGIPRR